MDEKTEELRDIFVDVTDESTVTERQEDTPGSLARDEPAAERVEGVVASMRERYDFDTDLPDAALADLVEGFYDGLDDAALAERAAEAANEDDADEETGSDVSEAETTEPPDLSRRDVFRARMDLHLVREADTDAPFALGDLRDRLTNDESIDEIAADLDAAESTVRRYRRVLETQAERRRVGDRFREEFDEILADADLASLTEDVTRDGLDDATDGMENDLSF
ncbi:conditioned medium-induced protein 4 [Halococcus sp. PRR34]|uniref:conditioned medium-induced protein 4 n=1 Tax=Halococcus sp. PRR34 TaxID=3020830 RepID=UPI00235E7B37|nr:conditioned medium-induced protein 4 [Halococcus sp. PRR34]